MVLGNSYGDARKCGLLLYYWRYMGTLTLHMRRVPKSEEERALFTGYMVEFPYQVKKVSFA